MERSESEPGTDRRLVATRCRDEHAKRCEVQFMNNGKEWLGT